jgi:hypothetical protein
MTQESSEIKTQIGKFEYLIMQKYNWRIKWYGDEPWAIA